MVALFTLLCQSLNSIHGKIHNVTWFKFSMHSFKVSNTTRWIIVILNNKDSVYYMLMCYYWVCYNMHVDLIHHVEILLCRDFLENPLYVLTFFMVIITTRSKSIPFQLLAVHNNVFFLLAKKGHLQKVGHSQFTILLLRHSPDPIHPLLSLRFLSHTFQYTTTRDFAQAEL